MLVGARDPFPAVAHDGEDQDADYDEGAGDHDGEDVRRRNSAPSWSGPRERGGTVRRKWSGDGGGGG